LVARFAKRANRVDLHSFDSVKREAIFGKSILRHKIGRGKRQDRKKWDAAAPAGAWAQVNWKVELLCRSPGNRAC
jgi:hypothetical protein